MKLKLKESPREWQKFTWAGCAAFILAGWLLQRRGVVPGELWTLLVLGAVPSVLCAIRPAWFRGFYRLGLTVGFHIGQIVGKTLLFALFFVVVTPLGCVLRWAGKDLLNLKRKPETASYWRPADRPTHLDRQF